MTTNPLHTLSDDELIAATTHAAQQERQSTAELLTLLIEVERRRLHLALGHSSLFVYCVRALRFSEQAAYSRITAARAARRFPQILLLLAEGALTLSSIERLAPHLTDDTVAPLLEAARFKSTREVERLVATVYPQPDVPTTVRAAPSPKPLPLAAPIALEARPAERCEHSAQTRPVLAPLAPHRYYLKLTIDQETHDALERLRALLRHSVTDGDIATIVSRALKILLQETERTRLASTARPRPASESKPAGRHVPASVRRAVWTRDGSRCAFVGSAGRCGEAAFLELHHVVPFARGGPTTVANLELRCRAHNAYEAVLEFGP